MMREMWTTSLVLLLSLTTVVSAAPKSEAACKVARELEAEQTAATEDETNHIKANQTMKDTATTAENKKKEAEAATEAHTKAKEKYTKAGKDLQDAQVKVTEAKTAKEAEDAKVQSAEQTLQQLQAQPPAIDDTGVAGMQHASQVAEAQQAVEAAKAKQKEAQDKLTAAEGVEKEKQGLYDTAKSEEETASTKARTATEAATAAKTAAEQAVTAETAASDKRKGSTAKLADNMRARSNQAYRCPDFKVTPLALALSHTKYDTFKKVKDAMLARIKDDPQKQLFGGQASAADLASGKVKAKDELGRLLGDKGLGAELTSRDTLMKNLDARMQEYARTRQGVTDKLSQPLPKWEPVQPVDPKTLDQIRNGGQQPQPKIYPIPTNGRANGIPQAAVWNTSTGRWELGSRTWDQTGRETTPRIPSGPVMTA